MDGSNFIITAKQNNEKIYLIEYRNKNGVGFVIDIDRGFRYADDLLQSIRKTAFWVDFRCSQNIAKRILEMIGKLKVVQGRYSYGFV